MRFPIEYLYKMAAQANANQTNIYVLRLTDGKYYVGKSANVKIRVDQHLVGDGSAWTRKYTPVAIDKVIENVSPFEEDKITKEYMLKYGIENVRGGSYANVVLSDEQLRALRGELWSATDKCTRCGRTGHFVASCFASRTVDGERIDEEEEEVWECTHCRMVFSTESACERHERDCRKRSTSRLTSGLGACFRCGRTGHYSYDCYAARHVDGSYLSDSD